MGGPELQTDCFCLRFQLFLEEKEPTEEELWAGLRRATISLKFVPVMMGSAYKNKGVQALLDGVIRLLPTPTEVVNKALDLANNEAEVITKSDPAEPLVALAFKLQESPFGQLTYLRIYQVCLAPSCCPLDALIMWRGEVRRGQARPGGFVGWTGQAGASTSPGVGGSISLGWVVSWGMWLYRVGAGGYGRVAMSQCGGEMFAAGRDARSWAAAAGAPLDVKIRGEGI